MKWKSFKLLQGHFLPEKKIDFKIFDGVAIPSSQFDATWK
jgi:hypothetical protein